LVSAKAILPEGPGLPVNYSFVKPRDVHLCFTSKSLFLLLEIPSFLKLPNMFLYLQLRPKGVTDPRREQLIKIKSKEQDQGGKTDSWGVTRTHTDGKSLTLNSACALEMFSVTHCLLFTDPLLCIGTEHLLLPSILPRRSA